MKKLYLLVLLVSLFCLPTLVFADATDTSTINAKSGSIDYMSGGSVAVTDQGSGYTQQVDSYGAASVVNRPAFHTASTIASADGIAYHTSYKNLVSGACRVMKIVVGGPQSAAGEGALVYDALTKTGTPVFDVSVGTAQNTITIDLGPGGVKFDTGVTVASTLSPSPANEDVVTIVYDD